MIPRRRKLNVHYAYGLGQWRWDLWEYETDYDRRLLASGFGETWHSAFAFGRFVFKALT